MITKKSPKISYKFFCEKCDYKCGKQSEYNKHLNTAKHKKITNDNDFTPKKHIYICEHCDKEFKYASGLSRHHKKCMGESKNEIQSQEQPDVSKLITSDMIMTLLTQNQELMMSNKEFKELIVRIQTDRPKPVRRVFCRCRRWQSRPRAAPAASMSSTRWSGSRVCRGSDRTGRACGCAVR